MTTRAFQKVYTKIDNITKATITLRASGVGNDELATVGGKLAQVVKIMGDNVTLQVFAGTEGLATDSEVVFHGEPPKLRVSDNLAGRFFNAYGEPLEGGEPIEGEEREIGGPTVNPFRRKQPSELIATGIAGIDLNNTIVSGQKIPFFADPDQPYNAVMANVALRAKADKIILGGMGLSNDDFLYFKQVFENAGALDRIVSFVNTTENPPVERLLVPDMALTAAEYFAADKGEKVLVLLTDMTLYADALAIVSNRMDQIPSKDSMPGSLYSDLAKIYEKAVQLPNGGSITIIAVTTLSGGDITHAIPDNTGYITEGQLFLRNDSDTGKVIVDPFHPRQRGLHHRGTALPAQRLRYGQGHRRPVPFAVASEAARDRQEDPRGSSSGDERLRAPLCRRRQCQDQAGERFRPFGLRRARVEVRARLFGEAARHRREHRHRYHARYGVDALRRVLHQGGGGHQGRAYR